MSTDLKIEIFAYYSFYEIWSDMGFKNILKKVQDVYRDECYKDNSYSEACDFMFKEVIRCRSLAFSIIYLEEINFNKAINWESLSEFYDNVTRVCDRNDWFGHLTIFERMFATCAYVLYLCSRVWEHSLIDVVNYGPIIWAMYFDKFTEKFYEEGGWNELKRVAEKYECPNKFLTFLRLDTKTDSYRHAWKEASVNYIQFKKSVKYDISKYNKNRILVCKLWIKFNIEHFEEYIRIPLRYENSVDNFETEMLLQQLKFIFESFNYRFNDFEILLEEFQGTYSFKGMLFSKTTDKTEEVKTHEDLRIGNVNTNETVCNEFPDSKKCSEIQFQTECSISNEYQRCVSPCETNAILMEMSTLKHSQGENDMKNSDERINTIKELDKLREERADPEIRNFLRMILVLDDRQGIEYVYGTLRSGEEVQENSKVTSNKKKNKSTKKSKK